MTDHLPAALKYNGQGFRPITAQAKIYRAEKGNGVQGASPNAVRVERISYKGYSIMPYIPCTPQQKSLTGFLMLLAYAASHPHSRQWLCAIPVILSRLEVRHA